MVFLDEQRHAIIVVSHVAANEAKKNQCVMLGDWKTDHGLPRKPSTRPSTARASRCALQPHLDSVRSTCASPSPLAAPCVRTPDSLPQKGSPLACLGSGQVYLAPLALVEKQDVPIDIVHAARRTNFMKSSIGMCTVLLTFRRHQSF